MTARWKLLKVWQIRRVGLCFHVHRGSELGKAYLLVDVQAGDIRICLEKPQDIEPTGAIVNLVRKHAPSGFLQGVWYTGLDYLLRYVAGPRVMTIRLRSKKGELEFIDEADQVLCTMTRTGTFTKKHAAEPPISQIDLSTWQEVSFDDPTVALDAPESKPAELTHLPPLQKALRGSLKRRLKTVRKSLDKLNKDLPTAAAVADAENRGQWLKQFAYLYTPGASALTIPGEEVGLSDSVKIPLDADYDLGKNMEQKFRELRRARRSLELGGKRSLELAQEVSELQDAIDALAAAIVPEEQLVRLASRFKVKTPAARLDASHSKEEALPYRTYFGVGMVPILVGKSSKDSDEMVKNARSDDYWFHTVAPKGAHVLISKRSVAIVGLSERLRREACILALHFSKAAQDFAGEVYCSEKRHIKKKKGLPPGLWLVEKSDILYVKYADEELRTILSRKPLLDGTMPTP